MKKPYVLKLCLSAAASFGLVAPASGQLLDTLEEYGNAAQGDAESWSDPPAARGFTVNTDDPANTVYTLTAGGTDFWSATDHGSMIYEAGATVDGNFSAIVRSVSIAGDLGEGLAGEWGRTGIMARTDPTAANSANVAHIRKTGGTNNGTVLQFRDTLGGGTSRTAEDHGNGFENTENFDVRDTAMFLGLHRYDGVYYTTWSSDIAPKDGIPDGWSEPQTHPATADTEGSMTIGLVHQSHNIHPEVNTAVFDHFAVGAFDASLGQFPPQHSASVTVNGNQMSLTAFSTPFGGGDPMDVNWKVELLGPPEPSPGVAVDIYFRPNQGALQGALDWFDNNAPDGSAVIQGIHWGRGEGYPLEFFDATGTFDGAADSVNNFTIDHNGEIYIPPIAERNGPLGEFNIIQFKDGVDDFCFLEIDGQELINDNAWTGQNGSENNGSPIAEFDASDSKYDDGEWVPFRFITAEGGGGDGGFLYWDVDDDGFFPLANADPAGPEYYVPDDKFRTSQPSVQAEQSGVGQPNNQLLTLTLTPETTGYRVYAGDALILEQGLDNDNDGIPNEVEVANGLNPEDPSDAALDKDNDGLTNLEDYTLGTGIDNPDFDEDGALDGAEVNDLGTDPFIADTDGDGLNDGDEVAAGTLPLDPDTDKDGFRDGTDPNPLVFDQDKISIGLVGYWPLDESTPIDPGDPASLRIHPDYLGLHDGEDDPNQFEATAHTPGKFGNGVYLDGIDQNIIISGDENDFDFPGGSMTVSAWFRADAFNGSWQALVAKGEGAGWRMHRRGGDQAMAFTGGAAGDIEAVNNVNGETSNVNFDEVYHIVGVSEAGATQRLYINGVLVGQETQGPMEDRDNPMRIGANPDTNPLRYWEGMIDDVAVWNRALSDLMIARMWNNGDGASVEQLIAEDEGGGGPTDTAFEISSVARDSVTGSITIEFPSEDATDYVVEVSTGLGVWLEAADVTGAAGSTQVTLSAADIINALGAAPSGQVYVRVLKR